VMCIKTSPLSGGKVDVVSVAYAARIQSVFGSYIPEKTEIYTSADGCVPEGWRNTMGDSIAMNGTAYLCNFCYADRFTAQRRKATGR